DDSIYVSGTTKSSDFPVTRPPFGNSTNSAPPGAESCSGRDRFLLRLNPDKPAPVYATLFGTSCAFDALGMQVRPDGAAIIQLGANDTFPHRAPLSLGPGFFWTEVAPDGSELRYSGPLGSLSAVLAPDGTLLSIQGAPGYVPGYGLQRVTIPR